MTIDEAIAHAREKAKEIRENIIDGNNLEPYESYCNAMTGRCAEEHEQLAEWLEEFKTYREKKCNKSVYLANKSIDMIDAVNKGYEDGYNKAIDDLLEDANEMAIEVDTGTYTMKAIGIGLLEQIAEQLKAGGKNEKERNAFDNAKQIVQEVSEEFATDTNVGTNGWIPCSFRLPEEEADVLLSLRSLDVYTGFRANAEGCFYIDGDGYVEYENVIAWMPLPEPYKESEE